MQGRKQITPQLFYQVSLEQLVPQDDFYRRVNKSLNLHFLYKSTEKYYGKEGQESIDPVVFYLPCRRACTLKNMIAVKSLKFIAIKKAIIIF